MTLSTALNVALSGLASASRASGLVSENIANAMTPGYAKRSVELATNGISGGVRVTGITRSSDPTITANRRASEAAHGEANTLAGFFSAFEALVGGPDDPYSIASRQAEFEGALISAASNPGSKTRLDGAAAAAASLARAISGAAEGLRGKRSDAERSIGQQVERLNSALKDVEDLNARIQSVKLSGHDTATLLDQRQLLVDEINVIVPVRIAQRQHGAIALYSEGGAILLDGTAAKLNFSVAGDTAPHMSVQNGLLSGLGLNGLPLRLSGPGSGIAGGTLSAQFEIRDTLAPEAQADLDALARDLVERFEDPALDPSRGAADPGLFTDGGAAFDVTNTLGLANRLALNTAADPASGGESWRQRAGLRASAPGSAGDATLLNAMGRALTAARAQPTTRFGIGALTAAGMASALMSGASQNSASGTAQVTFAATLMVEMQRVSLEQGVDTDSELQSLMQIEQAYAANARVLEVIESLMDTLLRI